MSIIYMHYILKCIYCHRSTIKFVYFAFHSSFMIKIVLCSFARQMLNWNILFPYTYIHYIIQFVFVYNSSREVLCLFAMLGVIVILHPLIHMAGHKEDPCRLC